MTNDYGIDDAALEQRVAEMSDTAFDRLVERTRPPQVGAPISQQQARAEGRAKAEQLMELRAQSDARATNLRGQQQ